MSKDQKWINKSKLGTVIAHIYIQPYALITVHTCILIIVYWISWYFIINSPFKNAYLYKLVFVCWSAILNDNNNNNNTTIPFAHLFGQKQIFIITSLESFNLYILFFVFVFSCLPSRNSLASSHILLMNRMIWMDLMSWKKK